VTFGTLGGQTGLPEIECHRGLPLGDQRYDAESSEKHEHEVDFLEIALSRGLFVNEHEIDFLETVFRRGSFDSFWTRGDRGHEIRLRTEVDCVEADFVGTI
jgi:hypothetical protein